jgi:hypothetical protein
MMVDVGMETRQCTECNVVFPQSNFYQTTLKATGRVQFQGPCKQCYKLRIRKYDNVVKKRNNGISRSVLSRTKNTKPYAAHIINMAKKRSLKKGMEFSIDVEWFLSALESQDWKCAISGEQMEISAGTGKRLFKGVSIDRIDNSRGYVAENCWLVCYAINAFKSTADLAQVLEMCKSVVKKWDC